MRAKHENIARKGSEVARQPERVSREEKWLACKTVSVAHKPNQVGRKAGCVARKGERSALHEIGAASVARSVPKAELVWKLQALLHSGDLRIAASLPDAAARAQELQDFRVRFTEAGNATFNAREGAHDGLDLALAVAVFGLSRPEPVDAVRVAWARKLSQLNF